MHSSLKHLFFATVEKKGDVQEKVVLYAEVELEVISRDVFYLSVKQNAHL